MTPREKLQRAYELAFQPAELNRVWNRMKNEDVDDPDTLGEILDIALVLHQALPEEGVACQRALNRLALYQAKSRAFGMVRFLRNIRRRLGRPPLDVGVVPGHMVRDVGLPPLARS
jgi:hypothetical protein